MARAISDEELQLKQRARRRLIGAIVLVIAIVVVLPMVLDSEPRTSSQSVSVQIPSPDAGVFTSKVVPLPATPNSKAISNAAPGRSPAELPAEVPQKIVAAPAAPASPVPAKETPTQAPQEALKPVAKAVVEKKTGTQAKPPAKSAKPAPKSTKGGQFVVQVIALADAEKAKQMREKIAAAGIKSYTEVVKTSKGDVTRVRAGPFATRVAAEKAREQLKALGMNGNITTR